MLDPKSWRTLCGKAVALVGSQENFKREAAILKRLVLAYGSDDVERMIQGATALGWHSLKSLGSKDGLGRRWALERYWQDQNHVRKLPQLESLGAIFKAKGLV